MPVPPVDDLAESSSVQAFIAGRQADLLERAIHTVEECPAEELSAEAHRLAGTLGTYQLTAAEGALRSLEATAKAPESTGADIDAARATTLAALLSLKAERHAHSGGDGGA